jgi:hypothetical protein
VSPGLLIALAVLAVLIGVSSWLVVRRRRYLAELRGHGWTSHPAPELDWVLDHAAPPFGLGFSRSVDDSVSGTTLSGVPFHVFDYSYRGSGPDFDARVASLRLPLALPPLFVSQGTPRVGVDLPPVSVHPACLVQTADPRLATALLSPAVLTELNRFGHTADRLDLSVDGDHLVAVGAPRDPDELARYLESLADVVAAMDVAALAPLAVPPATAGFRFFGRPDWVLVDRDDSLLDSYGLATGGTRHRVEQVIRSPNAGLPLEAFVHRWETSRTITTRTSGRSTTRTVTEQHSETVVAVGLPCVLPQLSVNGGWGGSRVRFELEQFNDEFAVRTAHPRFASDVLHPRMMEYLLTARPPGFRIEGRLLRFAPAVHDTLVIGQCADFAHEFLARVPSFVWDDLGVAPPVTRSPV